MTEFRETIQPYVARKKKKRKKYTGNKTVILPYIKQIKETTRYDGINLDVQPYAAIFMELWIA